MNFEFLPLYKLQPHANRLYRDLSGNGDNIEKIHRIDDTPDDLFSLNKRRHGE